MVDIVDPATRSRMMAGIRGRNTRPELTLRSALHRSGRRFRLHDGRLPGRPDIVLPARRAVVLVHGCFWHRHDGCHWCSTPGSNAEFWQKKFDANVARDAAQKLALRDLDWRVAVMWECSLRRPWQADSIGRLIDWLDAGEPEFESPLVRPADNLDPKN
ncbi:very short patch repair endonuclease [Sphingomonas alpina]|uniref:DNA mismatch endonuclease Vsr n=1 Tax=Sphingomonas alpina TaxID=653931 RepID=A0A7H0LIZ2_9SPHN|nr:DNA mismatch endonuclease Vsr [Sphingomonas alpina]QNQ09645.1 DNA mismatch endonuclease Vsr [Sphingomonas alpina]